jgi:hypothetical protein
MANGHNLKTYKHSLIKAEKLNLELVPLAFSIEVDPLRGIKNARFK